MLIEEIDETFLDVTEAMAYGRKGSKIVKRHRCPSGKRKGRLVAKPQQCSAPIDLKKSRVLKKTKAGKGKKMARKAKKTKRLNQVSKRATKLNKSRSKK